MLALIIVAYAVLYLVAQANRDTQTPFDVLIENDGGPDVQVQSSEGSFPLPCGDFRHLTVTSLPFHLEFKTTSDNTYFFDRDFDHHIDQVFVGPGPSVAVLPDDNVGGAGSQCSILTLPQNP